MEKISKTRKVISNMITLILTIITTTYLLYALAHGVNLALAIFVGFIFYYVTYAFHMGLKYNNWTNLGNLNSNNSHSLSDSYIRSRSHPIGNGKYLDPDTGEIWVE